MTHTVQVAESPETLEPDSFVFEGVTKWFDTRGRRVTAVSDLNLTVPRGEFVSVVGPSGCGKSTLLNMISGLMKPSAGTLNHVGHGLIDQINTDVAYITQADNLMPWSTVWQNVEMPLKIKGVARKNRAERVERELARVGLTGFENHYPAELSGGMRKRASLARTMIYEPQTLLMDEPFGALDAQVKVLMHEQLLRLWQGSGRTVLFITHDLDEAVVLSDRVVVMSSRPGRIKHEEKINLPRPRDPMTVRHDPEFVRIVDKLWNELKDDIRLGTEA